MNKLRSSIKMVEATTNAVVDSEQLLENMDTPNQKYNRFVNVSEKDKILFTMLVKRACVINESSEDIVKSVIDLLLKEHKVSILQNYGCNNVIVEKLRDISKNTDTLNDFVEQSRETIKNADDIMDQIKARVNDQISNTVNSKELYRNKMEDIKNELESKIVKGELKEDTNLDLRAMDILKSSHKFTIMDSIQTAVIKNIVSSKAINEIMEAKPDLFLESGELNIPKTEDISITLYSVLETINSLEINSVPMEEVVSTLIR